MNLLTSKQKMRNLVCHYLRNKWHKSQLTDKWESEREGERNRESRKRKNLQTGQERIDSAKKGERT